MGSEMCIRDRSYHSTFCWFEADAAGDCDFGGLLAGATYNATDPNPNLEGYTAAWADYNASDPNATAPTILPTHESLPLHTPQPRSHTTQSPLHRRPPSC